MLSLDKDSLEGNKINNNNNNKEEEISMLI